MQNNGILWMENRNLWPYGFSNKSLQNAEHAQALLDVCYTITVFQHLHLSCPLTENNS